MLGCRRSASKVTIIVRRVASRADRTRARILAAAHRALEDGVAGRLSLGTIAALAGVSRQTLYLHFGSRHALFIALMDWVDGTLGLRDRLQEARRHSDPVVRLVACVRVAADYERDIAAVAAAIDDLRRSDPDLEHAWQDRMERRRSAFAGLLADVAAVGALREGMSVPQAAQIVWHLTSPVAYRELVLECGWSHEDWVAYAVDAVVRLVLSPHAAAVAAGGEGSDNAVTDRTERLPTVSS
ncbi:MAG: TetR/AcrR family transcriptional regulator [Deltaproteobacteria bacterium]|nr:MAG: TetR/AcrR family transcriptional regulator [Deltaproteobacteria bacterium]